MNSPDLMRCRLQRHEVWGPLEATLFRDPHRRTPSAARARALDTRSPAFALPAAEELRHRRDSVTEAVTTGVAAIYLVLQNPLTLTSQIRSHLRTVSRYEELKSLDTRILENIDVDELEADLFESYEYDENVATIRT